MAKVPTSDEHARLWSGLSFGERRAIMRAVNRGVAVDNRKHARIAVGAARQQQRYWRWAWVLGPLAGLLLIPNWVAVVANSILLGLVMGALAYWRLQRARRAEEANLEVVTSRKRKKSRAAPAEPPASRPRFRLPWRRPEP